MIEDYLKSAVKLLSITNDGNILIAYYQDGQICLYNITNASKEKKFLIKKFSIDPDSCGLLSLIYFSRKVSGALNPYILASTDKGSLIEVNLSSGDVESELKLHCCPIMFLKYNQFSNNIIAGAEDQVLFLLKIDIDIHSISQSVILNSRPGYCEEILDIKPASGRNILFSSNDLGLKYYDAATQKTKIFDGHKDFIMQIDYKDGFVSTASKDGTVRVWKEIFDDAQTGLPVYKTIFSLKGHTEAVNYSCLLIKNGLTVCSVGKDKSLKVWDLTAKAESFDFDNLDFKAKVVKNSNWTEIIHDEEISIVKSSPNEKLLVTGGEDKLIKLWKISKDMSNGEFKVVLDGELKGHSRNISDFSFCKYAKLGVSCSTDKTIRVWNLNNFNCITTFTGHLNAATKVEWVYYGTHILSAGGDGLVKLWNLKSSENVVTLNCHEGKIWSLSLIEGESTLNFYSGSNDSKLCLWVDNTAEVELLKLKEIEAKQQKEDLLCHVLNSKSYIEAMRLSLELNKKSKFFENFMTYINQKKKVIVDEVEVILENRKTLEQMSIGDMYTKPFSGSFDEKEVIEELNSIVLDYAGKLLEIVRDNNIKYNTFYYAQILLKIIIKIIPYTQFLGKGAKIKGSKAKSKKENISKEKVGSALEMLSAGLPSENQEDQSLAKFNKLNFIENFAIIKSYTDKHLDRLDREITSTYMIDMILDSLILIPDE